MAIAIGSAMVVGLVLWRLYRVHKGVATGIGVSIAVVLLIGDLLEPFVWLAGLTRRSDSDGSAR
jgi:hypothetical protein